MDDFARELRETRRRRILYAVFTLSVVASAVICGVLLFAMINQPIHLVRLGNVDRFVLNQPVDVAVKQLDTSKLIPTRSNLDEDVIFVVNLGDGQYRALLGIDPVNGCFLSWRAAARQFSAGCTANTYDINGIVQNGVATSASRPVNMVVFPTEVRDKVVYLQDRIQQRDIR